MSKDANSSDGKTAAHSGRPGETPRETREASDRSHRNFVRNLFKRGEEFIEELLSENEKHRMRIMQLENEIRVLRKEIPPDVAVEELRALFDKLKQEHEELRKRYDHILAETKQYKRRYQVIEEENDKLVNLFVASYQLHSTLDFSEVVQILMEILLNFVGAGRFALYMIDENDSRFHPLAAYGLTLSGLGPLELTGGPAADALARGRPYVAQNPFSADIQPLTQPAVLIPLAMNTQVIGAVAIYGFLQQKKEIVPIDMELFKLLADHAGAVLESARLYCTTGQDARTMAAYRSLLPRETEP